MRAFYQLLFNSLIVGVTNNFVWFGLTFWAFLETKSVLTTSIVSGVYLAATALSGFWLGSIVDHNRKKDAMLMSSFATLILFSLGLLLFVITPEALFLRVQSFHLWGFVLLLLCGVIAGNIRNIALATATTILVPEEERDKANGMSGTVMGIAFAITSVASGVVLGAFGMTGVLGIAVICTLLAIFHLLLISIPEKKIIHTHDPSQSKLDIKGTIRVVKNIPGLVGLIFFNTLNNLLGGVFMSLMDAYGLSLVSVQTWGFLWGFLSLGFILGGIIVAKRGLGKTPLKTMFLANIVMWIIACVFTIQPWIVLLVTGMFIWISLAPIVEASEQTVLQKVVPQERQGRVFGFAQSIEQTASPFMAFFIGPIAQFIFIPFMTTGAGVKLIGWWYGIGTGRGIALVFTITGIVGLCITIIAMRSSAYRLLSKKYLA